jgi:hypothetical protein
MPADEFMQLMLRCESGVPLRAAVPEHS